MPRRAGWLALAVSVLGILTSCTAPTPLAERQAAVERKGREVMPFDLDKTTHLFDPTPEGGVQRVVADDPADVTQIGLIREHVRDEAEAFARGDFGDPTRIHGHAMPGLETLKSRFREIHIRYADIPTGGKIRYASESPKVVAALHEWFEAQVMDHGDHAAHSK